MIVFKILFLFALACLSLIRLHYTTKNREPIIIQYNSALDKSVQFLSGLGFTIIPLIFIFTPCLNFANIPCHQTLIVIAGAAGCMFIIAALWASWRAFAELGRNWSAAVQIKKDQTLVTTGIYQKVRHPLYAANLLWGIAQLLLLPNWIAGPAMLITFIPFYLVRVKQEEKLLLEHFGQQYRTYCIQTARFRPRRH